VEDHLCVQNAGAGVPVQQSCTLCFCSRSKCHVRCFLVEAVRFRGTIIFFSSV